MRIDTITTKILILDDSEIKALHKLTSNMRDMVSNGYIESELIRINQKQSLQIIRDNDVNLSPNQKSELYGSKDISRKNKEF